MKKKKESDQQCLRILPILRFKDYRRMFPCVFAIIKAIYKDKFLLNSGTFSGSHLVVASDSLFLSFLPLPHLSVHSHQ